MSHDDYAGTSLFALAADVANNATVDVGYPVGTVQNNYNAGLGGPGGYVYLDNNDKLTVAAAKVSFSYGASLITITNTSGYTWKAGQQLTINFDQVDNNLADNWQFRVELASVAAGDVITNIRPGVDGTLEWTEFLIDKPVTTISKLATLTWRISGVLCTGGVIALTSANSTPQGKSVQGSLFTAGNVIKRSDTLSLVASAVTAFSEGSGSAILRVRRSASL